MRFNDMPISGGTKDAVAAMGYENPTPIQEKAIPVLLQGNDVIGRARTGTGKTAAFGVPMIEALRDTRATGVLGLVLVPTRELANQVAEVLTDLARASPLQVATVFGGVGFGGQIAALRRKAPTILVACPGRLLDLMGRGDARLRDVQVLVLDEADRMLDMGFIHDIRRIVKEVPGDRQTSLFSATLDARVRGLSKDFMRDPTTIEVESGPTATELTDQYHIRVEKPDKRQALLALLHREQPEKGLVFTRTKHLAKRLAQQLQKEGWASVALQGNMTQNQRERAMEAFRAGDARLLVATDVAARGLDVPDITHVVNYDIPMEPEAYVHRIGRTGRNGRTGRSFTFLQSDEHKKWRDVQHIAGLTVPGFQLEVAGVPRGPDTHMPAGTPRPQPKRPQRSGRPRGQGTGGRQGAPKHRGGPRRHGRGQGGRRGGGYRGGSGRSRQGR